MTCEYDMNSNSLSIKFYGNTALFIWLHTVCGCFQVE